MIDPESRRRAILLELADRLRSPKDYDGQRESERSKIFKDCDQEQVAAIAFDGLEHHTKATAWTFHIAEQISESQNWGWDVRGIDDFFRAFKSGTYVLHQMVLMGLCRLEFSTLDRYKCYVIMLSDDMPEIRGRGEASTSTTPFPQWDGPVDAVGNRLMAEPAHQPEPWMFTGDPPPIYRGKIEGRFWHPYLDKEQRNYDYACATWDVTPANDMPKSVRPKLYRQEPAGPVRWVQAVHNVEANAYRINSEMLDIITQLDAYLPNGYVPKLSRKAKTDADRNTVSKRAMFDGLVDRATELKEQDRFYQRVFLDYRGRMYLSRSLLNYQGNDVARSLIEFADGVELNRDGFDALLLHAANLADVKGSVNKRIKYARANLRTWIEYAKKPLATYDQWTKDENGEALDHPLLFIRACIELRDATTPTKLTMRKGYVSHIPVEVDQSNSVIQHLALMQNDDWTMESSLKLAEKAGLLGSKDMYTELAKTIRISEKLSDKQRRKLLKKTIVPRVYGAGVSAIEPQWLDCGIPVIDRMAKSKRLALIKDVLKMLDSPDGLPQMSQFARRTQQMYRDLQELKGEKGVPVTWATSMGFTVEVAPEYSKETLERVALSAQDHRKGRADAQIKARYYTGGIHAGKVVKALQAAIIHSCDAAVVHGLLSYRDYPVIPIHDAFACHANNVDDLRKQFIGSLASYHGPTGLPWYYLLKQNLGTPLPESQHVEYEAVPIQSLFIEPPTEDTLKDMLALPKREYQSVAVKLVEAAIS